MIGVLALQGGVQEHLAHLHRLQIPARPVNKVAHFHGLQGLILPGGESTCLSRLLGIFELMRPLEQLHRQGVKLWGTCAGAILLANRIEHEKPHLQLLDIQVRRNAFGSQLDSEQRVINAPRVTVEPHAVTFIRAPLITHCGAHVTTLATVEQGVVAAEDDQCLATVFHPELTPITAWHHYFARKCGLHPKTDNSQYQATDWMQFNRH